MTIRPRHRRRIQPPPEVEGWLRGNDTRADWQYFEDLAAVWREHAGRILAEHVKEAPGTRPARWWTYDAPEPRKRLGGIGTMLSECTAQLPVLEFGIELYWRDVDPNDPPGFESEAAYLARLGLLLPGERDRLGPDAFEVEIVEIDNEDEDEEISINSVAADHVP